MKNKMHLLLALLVLRIRSELKKFQISVQSHMNNNPRHIILSYFYLTKQSQIRKHRVENLTTPDDTIAWRSTFKQQWSNGFITLSQDFWPLFFNVASPHWCLHALFFKIAADVFLTPTWRLQTNKLPKYLVVSSWLNWLMNKYSCAFA